MSEEICQIERIPKLSDGIIKMPLTLKQSISIFLIRLMPRKFKRRLKNLINRYYGMKEIRAGRAQWKAVVPVTGIAFQEGEWVRVRAFEEIEATLDHFKELKGCKFITAMRKYCGTNQRVLKPVRRFLDERENQIRRSSNLYLLDGLMCQGLGKSGPCDRSCHYFWRGEWLEKSDQHPTGSRIPGP